MGQRFIAVGVALALLLGSLAVTPSALAEGKPAPQVPWTKVPEPERKVLTPLEKDWAQLAGSQQRKLVGAAKTYPKLAPIQQERFQERIRDWASLSPDQRRAARDKFNDLSRLPPEQQYQLRERWNDKATQQTPPASANSPAPQQPAAQPK